MKIAVIGSGLSGLSAAALLGKAGHSVTIYEQHEKIGGVTAGIEKDGFKWDLGQMLLPDLGEGEPGRLVLEGLGISAQVKTVRSWRGNVFPDYEIWRPEEYQGRLWRKAYFKSLFPEDAKGLDDYYDLYERILDLLALSEKSGMAAKIKLYLKMLPIFPKRNWSAEKLLGHFFTNKKLKAAFSAILADYVTQPAVFPGLFIPGINYEQQYDERVPLDYEGHEHRSSWTYIIDGCSQLVKALAGAVTSNGGKIRTDTPVKQVVVENKKVSGILLKDGTTDPVDGVVASGGARELFLNMVGREYFQDAFLKNHVDNLSTMESVFMVHLGVDYDPSIHMKGSALCYYYKTYDIEGAIRECEEKIYHQGKDGFLIYVPSVHSPGMAPEGHHAATVYTIAPNYPVNGSWAENGEAWADDLLEAAEEYVPGLREHTKTRVVLTPEFFRDRTYLAHHAFGGCPPRVDKSPPPHKTPVEGVWFVGAQSEAFGGVTNAMTSAGKVVKTILEKG